MLIPHCLVLTSLTGSIFISQIVNFVGIGLALYALAVVYQIISGDSIIDQTVECEYCKKDIDEEVGTCCL